MLVQKRKRTASFSLYSALLLELLSAHTWVDSYQVVDGLFFIRKRMLAESTRNSAVVFVEFFFSKVVTWLGRPFLGYFSNGDAAAMEKIKQWKQDYDDYLRYVKDLGYGRCAASACSTAAQRRTLIRSAFATL
jgi:hypothetical protein